MNEAKLHSILLAPHISEKTNDNGQYGFKVLPQATKTEIKAAVEMCFQVKVKSVSTVNIKGKQTRFRQRLGRRKNWKKAYVTLVPGSEIDIAVGE